ncbi:acylneuraminate cytidylyltransferase family protein [Dehalococcoidia bacterium]|nr:acylneuraminate cytidylyltransferase family protein [Dehalococcoidia bacterium]
MKGHSERVPGKNMRSFCGRPLFHWIIRSLQNSMYITRIIINTDSQAIAKKALDYFHCLDIVKRPEAIQGDFVSMNDIIAYDLSQIEGEHFLQTHSTNPLLTTATIDKAIECYFNRLETHDSLFSVTRRQVRLYWQDGRPINHKLHNPQESLRTQDLDPIYEENSCLYIFSRTSFSQSRNWRIGLKPQMFEIEKLEAVDIDEEPDFRLAEALHRLKYVQGDS